MASFNPVLCVHVAVQFILLKLYFAVGNSICINFKALFSLLCAASFSFPHLILCVCVCVRHHPQKFLLQFYFDLNFHTTTTTTNAVAISSWHCSQYWINLCVCVLFLLWEKWTPATITAIVIIIIIIMITTRDIYKYSATIICTKDLK